MVVPLLSQGATTGGGAMLSSVHQRSLKFANPIPPLFTKRHTSRNFSISRTNPKPLTLSNATESSSGSTKSKSSSKEIPFEEDGANSISFVGQENVPLEGVIQFDKSDSAKTSPFAKWSRVALLAGGDVAMLLLFSAIGRFSHGFPVFDFDTFKTVDPFIAGWFLSAYFLGGYGKDGRGLNGRSKAISVAAKSWSAGIPLGIIIRSLSIGHAPPITFVLVTIGSTGVLLVGWRALLYTLFPADNGKKSDVYKRGSPFELFELLTSLVRRW